MILELSEGPRASAKFSSALVSADEPQYAAIAGSGNWNANAAITAIIAPNACRLASRFRSGCDECLESIM